MLKISWSPIYAHPLPEGHRFPMLKYELIPGQLLYEGIIKPNNIFSPKPLQEKYIINTHTKSYWHKLKNLNLNKQEERRTGFPISDQLIQREIIIAKGTIDCANYAIKYGAALNVAGGTHHAFTDKGEGFCLLNDVAIASNYLLQKRQVNQILVVDLDVHQGNGTAQIFQNNPRVFTFSMHGSKNFPMKKEESDLDIGLADNTEDVTKLGRLALTMQGCKQRDQFVIEQCFNHKIPMVAVMGGGYAEDIKLILEAHCNTFRLVQDIYFAS